MIAEKAMPHWTEFVQKCPVLFFILFLVALTRLADGQVADPSSCSLYTDEVAVVDLSGTKWESIHPSAPFCPWLVVFYNDGCGHCRAIAPSYCEFAAGLESAPEDDVLRMVTAAAVNCAVQLSTCREHEINFVPNFFLFMPSNCAAGAKESCDAGKMKEFVIRSSFRAQGLFRLEVQGIIKENMHADGSMMQRCVGMRRSLQAEKRARRGGESSSTDPFVETRQLYATDIAGAFFLTMWNEVSLVGLDSPGPLGAVKCFLRIVEAALPGLGADALLEAVAEIENGTRFSVESWQEAVLAARIPYYGAPNEVQWRTCKGSSPSYRGFPCGMWLLYHSITVNVDAGGDTNPLEAIQEYVRYFFSCEECRQHFLEFNFTRDDDPVLQLWRAHNNVNARLAPVKEGADPFVPKRQFPDAEICGKCRNSLGAFDESEVAVFLRKWYEWDPSAISTSTDESGNSSYFFRPGSPMPFYKDPKKQHRDGVRYDPVPLHVFLTVFVTVAVLNAGIFRTRRRSVRSLLHQHCRQKI
ncbi:quiescin sulfhydryl oxidase (QSOX) [Trypanosoma cruzi cruzi]|uniref:Sulfhydryl oxidase n=1 Tax=Trypanosoma cruzi TaxID=5693 RepID=A0A2V2V5I9_TRYCR|nr:quiescin sulfhydryl oxidase (QSOX) [Trypanosoma cruzi cruzi]PWU91619.1 putative quiescin sulfhydryl oxidase [Trypanosoma cruzi]